MGRAYLTGAGTNLSAVEGPGAHLACFIRVKGVHLSRGCSLMGDLPEDFAWLPVGLIAARKGPRV